MKKARTPPLYLRIKDVQQQHNEEIEKFKKNMNINIIIIAPN